MPLNRPLAALTGAVYFIQGALGLSAIALPLFLREAHFDIKSIATLSSVAALPWLFKPLYAALSDAFPIAGYRRKSYIIICSALSTAGWWALAVVPSHLLTITLCMLLANVGFAATDVATDGLIVEHSTDTTSQGYQSLAWGFRSVGAIVSGVAGGWLATHAGYRTVFLLTGLLPLISLVFALQFNEKKKTVSEKNHHILSPLLKSLRLVWSGELRWFCALLIIGSASASYATPLFFYFKDNLAFAEVFLGLLSSLSWIGAILGCAIYYKLMKKMSLVKTLRIAIALDVLGTLLCLFIFNKVSAVTLGIITGTMAYITLLPLMAIAAKLAHGTGVESSLFAILMSVRNIGIVLFTFIGGQLYGHVGLKMLILLSAAVGAGGFYIIQKIDTKRS